MATAESTKPLKITSPPGVSIPLLAGAVGKVFLAAFDNPDALKLIREYGLRRFTGRSIVNEGDYLAELDHVREQGYALDNEEYMPGVKAVAVNLGNHRGLPLALWVVGFAGSMAEKAMPRIIEGILNSAHKLRTLLDNGP